MNTKTDGISSGLVAVAWLAPSNYEWPSHFISMTEIRNGEPLVRLSDAEAIVAAKDAEIAAWKNDAINGGNAGYLREVAEHQAERIKELETQFKQTHEWLCDRNQQIHEQSAALKLAREALDTISSLEASNGCILSLRECVDIAEEALAAIDALKGE